MSDGVKKALTGAVSAAQSSVANMMKSKNAGNTVLGHRKEPQMPVPDVCAIPSEREANEYQSARMLMRRLADSITQWRGELSDDVQPAILALLHGGIQIDVECLAEESFHGIRVEGTADGAPCVVLAHQSSVQLLCYARTVEKEEERRTIGFIIDGKKENA